MLEETKITVALIAAAASIAGCVANWFAARNIQKKAAAIQQENHEKNATAKQYIDRRLERLKAELEEEQSKKKARRDYEYEALRRLYKECSPVLFQLSESSAAGFDRIKSLARSAADGKLGELNESWLTEKEYRYYLSSTEYRILAPLAYFAILKEKITHLDMALEPEIQALYVLARQSVRVLSEDFKMAEKFGRPIDYKPNLSEENPDSVNDPKTQRQQGIPRGIVESALEAMIERNSDGAYRIISFAKYDEIFRNSQSGEYNSFKRVRFFFSNFHPEMRPVTWRILVTEALIFRAIEKLSTPKSENQKTPTVNELFFLSDVDIQLFNWQAKNTVGHDIAEIRQSIDSAQAYLAENLYPDLKRALQMVNERKSGQ